MKIKLYGIGLKLTLEQITTVEKTIGHSFPLEYKDFLTQFNGGGPSPDCFDVEYNGQEWVGEDEGALLYRFFFMTDDEYFSFLDNYRYYKNRIPIDTIPIAKDAGRSLVLLGIEGANIGKIFYWNGEYSASPDEEEEEGYEADYRNVGFVANSFNEFLKGLYILEEDDDDNEYDADGEYEID